jgi:hypothetical protein
VKRYQGLEGQYFDPQFGWGEVVKGGIDTCLVDAIEHLQIFKDEPDRELVAKKLRSCFRGAVPELEGTMFLDDEASEGPLRS